MENKRPASQIRNKRSMPKGSLGSILKEKSYTFALRVINLYKHLVKVNKGYVLSKQILRSGTSIGANVTEGNQAQSKADFVHKMSTALKGVSETVYWLCLLRDSEYLTNAQADSLVSDCNELQKILTTSIKTAKKNLK